MSIVAGQTAYVTPAEAAHILGVSRSTVYRRIRNGQLPAYRHGWYWQVARPTTPVETQVRDAVRTYRDGWALIREAADRNDYAAADKVYDAQDAALAALARLGRADLAQDLTTEAMWRGRSDTHGLRQLAACRSRLDAALAA